MNTIFFDLDDTLFDHRKSALAVILAVKEKYALNTRTIEEMESEYDRLLSEMHPLVMGGRMTPDESRRKRYARLFDFCNARWDDGVIEDCLQVGLSAYRQARTAIEGAAELLRELRQDFRIGIISNNFLAEQQEKLRVIGLTDFIDNLIVSEEIGFQKPDKRIFDAALSRMKIGPHDCIMIGDSWESDVVGATNAGIHAIWFNRFHRASPDPSLASELHSLTPVSLVRAAITGKKSQ